MVKYSSTTIRGVSPIQRQQQHKMEIEQSLGMQQGEIFDEIEGSIQAIKAKKQKLDQDIAIQLQQYK